MYLLLDKIDKSDKLSKEITAFDENAVLAKGLNSIIFLKIYIV
jgi:hypothetical protein